MTLPNRFYLTLPLLLALSLSPAAQANAGTSSEPITHSATTQQNMRKESGLMLDTARRFYPVSVIKSFIDTLSASGGTFLHLHFSGYTPQPHN